MQKIRMKCKIEHELIQSISSVILKKVLKQKIHLQCKSSKIGSKTKDKLKIQIK